MLNSHESVRFTPVDSSEKYSSPPRLAKQGFSLAHLRLDKLSGPNSDSKNSKMVDYIIKKSSPYKAADGVKHIIQDAKLSSEKIEEYVRTMSKKTSPNKYTRPISKTNSNYKSKRKVKPSMKGSKSTSILESGSRLKGRS
jgi:hypothetical protein